MIDRYQPTLSRFSLTIEEQAAVASALLTNDPWGWNPGGVQGKAIKSVKNKLLSHHLSRHAHRCCYCRSNLYGGGGFRIDREHILPKHNSLYKQYTYTIWNLGASCKRCNMQYKGKKHDFVVNPNDTTQFIVSENYLFIHPNFDLYSEHISYEMRQSDDGTLVVYKVLNRSEKGAYTYDYFNLRELEVNSFDEVQGRDVTKVEGELALEVRALAETMGQ